mmetsp:Transcript_16258/g.23944  ORF Transcript_16258/g.23944 Transcript_16258/m.23944 type:complete len:222 (+) Transcript_16258:244-909(+)
MPGRNEQIFLISPENVHKRNRSRNALESEQTCHGNHSSTSLSHLNLLVSLEFFLAQLSLETQVVESVVTRCLGSLTAEVISTVSDTLTLSDADHHEDTCKPSGLLCCEDTEGLGPVGALRESRDVHSHSQTTNVCGPNTSPCKHTHTSMLDLSLLDKLLVGEHVGESIDILSDDRQLERIPDTLINFRSLQGSTGERGLLRGKGSSGSDKGGGEGKLHRDG